MGKLRTREEWIKGLEEIGEVDVIALVHSAEVGGLFQNDFENLNGVHTIYHDGRLEVIAHMFAYFLIRKFSIGDETKAEELALKVGKATKDILIKENEHSYRERFKEDVRLKMPEQLL